jgi:DNA-binding MarR family transcriptional regulator
VDEATESEVAGDGKLARTDYRALAAFRYQIRRFLHFSEMAARNEGLEPQQHQMMLGIHASPGEDGPTVGELADFLMIRHHSAVGLLDRLVERGLAERVRGTADRRQVRIRLTPSGSESLHRLSALHHRQLREWGPELVGLLSGVLLRVSALNGEEGAPDGNGSGSAPGGNIL